MCPDGRHCLIREYISGIWVLRCLNCTYLIQE